MRFAYEFGLTWDRQGLEYSWKSPAGAPALLNTPAQPCRIHPKAHLRFLKKSGSTASMSS